MARPMSPESREERRAEEIRHRLGCPFLEPEEAALYLRVAEQTLADHRTDGTGPEFRKHFGRIAYHIDDLDKWSESRKRVSTSGELVGARK